MRRSTRHSSTSDGGTAGAGWPLSPCRAVIAMMAGTSADVAALVNEQLAVVAAE